MTSLLLQLAGLVLLARTLNRPSDLTLVAGLLLLGAGIALDGRV